MTLLEYKNVVQMSQSSNSNDVVLAIQLLVNADVGSLLLRRVMWDVRGIIIPVEIVGKYICIRSYEIYPPGDIGNFNPTDKEIEDLLIKSDRNEIKLNEVR